MGIVSLQILEPANDANFMGSGNVHLRGKLVTTGAGPLFFKWYSSLGAPPATTAQGVLINPGTDPLEFTPVLPVGTQVITFTAKDQAGESAAELQAVKNAGMAGGPPPARAGQPPPCVIHVLIANIAQPASGATLSKAAAVLSAAAPSHWNKSDYQSLNKIQYVWKFDPSGPPPGRNAGTLTPTLAQLTFDSSGAVPVVRYSGALPAAIGTGNYTLTLRVQRSDNASIGHEVKIPVVVAP
jgi:hypothetical protein